MVGGARVGGGAGLAAIGGVDGALLQLVVAVLLGVLVGEEAREVGVEGALWYPLARLLR